jgi:hypothetical protein
MFERGLNFSWGQWAFKTTFSIKKLRKQPKGSESDSFQLSYDRPFMKSWDCHWKFWQASRCNQIYAVPAVWRSETKSCFLSVKSCWSCRCCWKLLKNIITGDETWIYGFGVETKAQCSQWVSETSPIPKKALQVWSNVKVMLTVFCDCEGFIHLDFVPDGQTEKKECYLKLM